MLTKNCVKNLDIKFKHIQFSILSGNISIRDLSITTISMKVKICRLRVAIKYWAKIPDFGENNVNQQFVFGQGNDFDIIKSELNQNLVWDVADADSIDPPSGTPFYLFPIHGKHNQRFVYKNQMIYATQNDQVVTYVGGETPFVMMQPSEQLKSRQTFRVKLL